MLHRASLGLKPLMSTPRTINLAGPCVGMTITALGNTAR